MARNVSKQSGRSNVNAGESSRHAVPYLVQGDEDDDDTMAQLSEDSNQIQVRQANVVASSGHMAETTVPNFLLKLWRLVEDKNYDFCICWDEVRQCFWGRMISLVDTCLFFQSGSSFHVKEPYTFSKDVLPLFFKHSNLNSFIRQLNMCKYWIWSVEIPLRLFWIWGSRVDVPRAQTTSPNTYLFQMVSEK